MRGGWLVGALLLGGLASGCGPASQEGTTIVFRYSRFEPRVVEARAGVPLNLTLRNDDPIEHEWIVGPPEVHEAHRVGTEAYHASRPTEVTVPAYTSKQTRIVLDEPGEYAFICHLPGHEAYGMVGTLRVVAG